jgi:hypothetical protein
METEACEILKSELASAQPSRNLRNLYDGTSPHSEGWNLKFPRERHFASAGAHFATRRVFGE